MKIYQELITPPLVVLWPCGLGPLVRVSKGLTEGLERFRVYGLGLRFFLESPRFLAL